MSFRSKPAPPPRKRIIIASDGTWQSSSSEKANTPSNVTRLCRNLAPAGYNDKGETVQQVVYYDPGIGTGSLATFERMRQGGTGDGLAVNVLQAYAFISNNYNP